ncbi:hypothetical protein DFH27DRAFT_142139 [Peziza echinospora]|nr:hypothetical protein DFH27DRAFT_142139 [Peziza echinospora]
MQTSNPFRRKLAVDQSKSLPAVDASQIQYTTSNTSPEIASFAPPPPPPPPPPVSPRLNRRSVPPPPPPARTASHRLSIDLRPTPVLPIVSPRIPSPAPVAADPFESASEVDKSGDDDDEDDETEEEESQIPPLPSITPHKPGSSNPFRKPDATDKRASFDITKLRFGTGETARLNADEPKPPPRQSLDVDAFKRLILTGHAEAIVTSPTFIQPARAESSTSSSISTPVHHPPTAPAATDDADLTVEARRASVDVDRNGEVVPGHETVLSPTPQAMVRLVSSEVQGDGLAEQPKEDIPNGAGREGGAVNGSGRDSPRALESPLPQLPQNTLPAVTHSPPLQRVKPPPPRPRVRSAHSSTSTPITQPNSPSSASVLAPSPIPSVSSVLLESSSSERPHSPKLEERPGSASGLTTSPSTKRILPPSPPISRRDSTRRSVLGPPVTGLARSNSLNRPPPPPPARRVQSNSIPPAEVSRPQSIVTTDSPAISSPEPLTSPSKALSPPPPPPRGTRRKKSGGAAEHDAPGSDISKYSNSQVSLGTDELTAPSSLSRVDAAEIHVPEKDILADLEKLQREVDALRSAAEQRSGGVAF